MEIYINKKEYSAKKLSLTRALRYYYIYNSPDKVITKKELLEFFKIYAKYLQDNENSREKYNDREEININDEYIHRPKIKKITELYDSESESSQ